MGYIDPLGYLKVLRLDTLTKMDLCLNIQLVKGMYRTRLDCSSLLYIDNDCAKSNS